MLERLLSSVTDQSLRHQTPRSWLLDPRVSSKGSLKPLWDLHTNWWPHPEDFQELKQTTAEGDSFPKMMRPGLYTLFLLLFLTLFSPFLGKAMLLSTSPNPLQKGKTFLLDLSPETPVCSRWLRPLGLICNQFLFNPMSLPIISTSLWMLPTGLGYNN